MVVSGQVSCTGVVLSGLTTSSITTFPTRTPGSEEAVRWAATYGLFHWGPIAWSIYLIPAIPIAYFFYVRKQPVLKISSALMPVLGEHHSRGVAGKVVDILFIFGLPLGGAATTLGLAAPLITEGLNHPFGLPKNNLTQVMVLLVCTAIFAYYRMRVWKKASRSSVTSTSGVRWDYWYSS